MIAGCSPVGAAGGVTTSGGNAADAGSSSDDFESEKPSPGPHDLVLEAQIELGKLRDMRLALMQQQIDRMKTNAQLYERDTRRIIKGLEIQLNAQNEQLTLLQLAVLQLQESRMPTSPVQPFNLSRQA
jgi:hypothetical protein